MGQWSIECRKRHERIYPLNNTRRQIPQAMRLGCRWLSHWGRTLPGVSMAQIAIKLHESHHPIPRSNVDLHGFVKYISIMLSQGNYSRILIAVWPCEEISSSIKCHLHPSKAAIMSHAWQGLEYLQAGEPSTGRDKLCCCKLHKNCPNHIIYIYSLSYRS